MKNEMAMSPDLTIKEITESAHEKIRYIDYEHLLEVEMVWINFPNKYKLTETWAHAAVGKGYQDMCNHHDDVRWLLRFKSHHRNAIYI